MKITVQVFKNSEEIFSKVFEQGVYRAGRSELSDIVLPHDSVSRSQVELRVTEASIYMTNMGAAKRIKRDGEFVETAEMCDGDELRIGPFRLVIFFGERANFASPVEEKPAEVNELFSEAPAPALSDPPAERPQERMADVFALDGRGGEPALEEKPRSKSATAPAFADAFPMEGTAALARAETQVQIKPVVAKLMFQEGPKAGEEFFLEAYEVTMGRSKKADIFLDDDKLSRVHAKITRVGMGYRLIDLNSRNGTYVNGMRILEHPLNSFDELQIGRSKIKFLIHDIMVGESPGKLAKIPTQEETRSAALGVVTPDSAFAMEPGRGAGPPDSPFARGYSAFPPQWEKAKSSKRMAVVVGGIVTLLLVWWMLSSGKSTAPASHGEKAVSSTKAPPTMPKEYLELSPESQKAVEGYYNTAQTLADKESYEEALSYLKRIHEALPFYKQSRELQELYQKKLKEKQMAEVQKKAQRDEQQDLALSIEEGLENLKEGDFDRAAEAFNSAIVIDPKNEIAVKGLKAAELKVRRIEDIPADKDPEDEKRKQVSDLFQVAVAKFTQKSYQDAIETAEKIRQIELKGDTQYLNEAKQIIDRAKMLQKEEFEPFLIQAKEKCAEGDFNSCRDTCEEMLKKDPAYEEAKQCATTAKKQLNKLAKEAYTHGYILESMNRLEEAKQYYNRAKTFVRTGDAYYDKVMKKLEYYQ